MLEQVLRRALDPLYRKLRLLLQRGLVELVSYDGKVRLLQVTTADGPPLDGIEHHEPYGVTSHPLPGSEAIVLSFAGNRSNTLVLQVGDRRHRLLIDKGEVAIYTHLGDKVHIKNDRTIEVEAALKVLLKTPLTQCTGDMVVDKTLTVKEATTLQQTLAVTETVIAGGNVSGADVKSTTSDISLEAMGTHTHDHDTDTTSEPNL